VSAFRRGELDPNRMPFESRRWRATAPSAGWTIRDSERRERATGAVHPAREPRLKDHRAGASKRSEFLNCPPQRAAAEYGPARE